MKRLRLYVIIAFIVASGVVLFVVQSGILIIRARPVTIDAGDVTLSGQLVMPRWTEPPYPAAVVVHGSGPNRWQDMKSWARKLVPQGMAVLLYDKRGVGKSTGTFSLIRVSESEEKLTELAKDASAALEWMRNQPEIDSSRVGFVGGSQAGWIMPLAASRTEGVQFISIVSGAAVSYGEEIYYSQLTGDDPGTPPRTLTDDEIAKRLDEFDGLRGYDPIPVLNDNTVPTLWLLGGNDQSVPTELSVKNLEVISESGNQSHTIIVYPTGDHNLRDSQTHKRIDYWSDMYGWLHEQGILISHE